MTKPLSVSLIGLSGIDEKAFEAAWEIMSALQGKECCMKHRFQRGIEAYEATKQQNAAEAACAGDASARKECFVHGKNCATTCEGRQPITNQSSGQTGGVVELGAIGFQGCILCGTGKCNCAEINKAAALRAAKSVEKDEA